MILGPPLDWIRKDSMVLVIRITIGLREPDLKNHPQMLAVVSRLDWARCRYPPVSEATDQIKLVLWSCNSCSVSHISPWYTSLVASHKVFHINIYILYNHVMSGHTISYHIPCVYTYMHISYINILHISYHATFPWLIPMAYPEVLRVFRTLKFFTELHLG